MKLSEQTRWVRHEAHGEIILNRPEKGNALTYAMLEDLGKICEEARGDRDLRAIVLRGEGDRFFCTGGDIEAWGSLTPHDMGRDWILFGIEAFERLRKLPQPIIAAINGHCLGGGLELAMAADLRLCTARAKFGTPEVTLGMIPGWMGVRRLAEIAGVSRARHLTLLGAPISAQTAESWGLVTAVCEDQEALQTKTAEWLAQLSGNGPSAMALVKGLLDTMHEDMAQHHASAVAQAAGTEDCREGVQAFLEKRRPTYTNR
ncbi:enoyl-CoA hydratase/isomerase family protein [Pseudovibrio exalbescens]|uniref:enoyl-CoA hydratase/isomerase family protein n=1 Tax=Pseudovibrio exalbescens TaxID=197461 RepID=UPI002366D2EF|nr:enoyl-CoA hydratase/isomerase family protein [Pseudovibrio exalbescens]MDD7910882.1 enoyl-CoA hydratase/isomerase family protein [Pseudovibrio exalbescens]